MTDFHRDFPRAAAATGDMALDAGLRSFMIGVYNKVALGLVLSGAIAYATASVPAVRDLLFVVDGAGRLRGMTVLGLIAYDTQRLKAAYYELGADQAARGVATNFGALTLYINFINLFQFLLHFMGQRR